MLPGRTDRILRDLWIGRQDRQPVRDCLADQHAVEGILMRCGQPGNLQSGGFVERQLKEVVNLAVFRNVLERRLGKDEIPEPLLHGNLPSRDRAQVDLVFGRDDQ